MSEGEGHLPAALIRHVPRTRFHITNTGDSRALARGSPCPLSTQQKEASFRFVHMWWVKPRQQRCHGGPDGLQPGLWSGEVRACDRTALPEHWQTSAPGQTGRNSSLRRTCEWMPADAEIFHSEVTPFVLCYTVQTTGRNGGGRCAIVGLIHTFQTQTDWLDNLVNDAETYNKIKMLFIYIHLIWNQTKAPLPLWLI